MREFDGHFDKMAIQFARLQYVQRSKGQSACHKAAYNGREKVYDIRQEKNFDFSDRGDCAYHAVMLPEKASEKYQDIEALWNAIEARENRADSQVAKEMVLALPDDGQVTLDDKIAMTRSFLNEHFIDHGIICQIDIHEPHSKENKGNWREREDHKDGNNWHVHVLMTTRPCLEGEVFGNKARNLDVDVRKGMVVSTDKQWGLLWGKHQNQYFRENGIDLVVDPVGVVPEIHLGPVRMRWKLSSRVLENEELKDKNGRYAQDERLVLQLLLRQDSEFKKSDVETFAFKQLSEQEQENFLGRFWSSKELVLVGEDRYTSKSVLREEQKMMRMADRLSRKNIGALKPNYEIDLNSEQKEAVDHVCLGPHLSCVEGRAGTGKSRALCAIRDTYEADGFAVRGLAPTSAVADDMKKNQFKYAANLHSFLFRHHYNQIDIARGKEIWLVDEAAMIPTPVMGELLDKAWKYNAKIVLIGDERQLVSIGRGGAFKAFIERFGSVSLETILRQKNDIHKAITEQISKGQTSSALDMMDQQGLWQHYEKEHEAVQGMMRSWYENYKEHPGDSFMILEYRNQYVKEFNNHIHAVLKERGEVSQKEIMVNTVRQDYSYFSVGDSIVFRENNAEMGVHNGQRGFLVAADKNRFLVRVNDHQDIEFDPQKYNDFQHGYAGTIHSSQGLTFDRVYALHSNHMNQNLFYVANSRHRLSCNYFSCGDKKAVYQSVLHSDQKTLCQETCNAEPKKWLASAVSAVKDYLSQNHEFYRNSHSYYVEKGVLITDQKEQTYLKGYRTLYREDQKQWPALEGISVRTVSKNADLEPLLRDQGVSQCVLLDVARDQSQLIGPYDRFHTFFKQCQARLQEHDITETQLRVRLFALEKRFVESPQSATEMMRSKSYETFMHNETVLKTELLRTYDKNMTTQILYHFEKKGDRPTDRELQQMQSRINQASQQFSVHQKDQFFKACLTKEDQKRVQFQKQVEMEM